MPHNAADVAEISEELAPFLKHFTLYSELRQHISQTRLFLQRNLTYYAPERSASYQATEASHFITVNLRALQLAAAYSHGLVLYVAVCRTFWQYGGQVRVPLAAKAVLLPSGGAPSLPVRLPITQPEGFHDSLAGLELLLLHQPATAGELGGGGQPGLWAEQSLLGLLGRTAALVERGGKAISCDLEPRAAFSWPEPGSNVLHFSVQLHDPVQHEAAVELLQGVFQTHLPDPAFGIPFPSLSIAQPQLSDDVRLEYCIHVRRAELPGTQGAAAAAGVAERRVRGPLPAGGAVCWPAAPGRDDPLGLGAQPAVPEHNQKLPREGQQHAQHQQQQQILQQQPKRRQLLLVQQQGQQLEQRLEQHQHQHQIKWHHPVDRSAAGQQEGASPACRLAGHKRRHAALSRAPPAPHAERAQQRPVWVSLFSRDGQLQTEQQMQGFYCIVCNLRCRSFEGLRQHLEASHDCFEYAFQEQAADGSSEIGIRCRPELFDESGEFLAGLELLGTEANKHPMKPWQSLPFAYYLPPHLRHTRWLPGFAPKLNPLKAPRAHPQVQTSPALDAALAQPTPQHSGMAAGLSLASLVSRGSGIEEKVMGEQPAATVPPRRREAARAGAQPAAKQRQPPTKVHRKKQPLPKVKPTVAPRSGQGLVLLTPEGRPKFYHSRTCVPMAKQELLAEEDSDDQSDDGEWARNCWQRLHQGAGNVPAAQRDFMFAWDQALRSNPLHADSDVPCWVQQFKAAQIARGLGDDPAFHRSFAAMVTNLWRYRLLTPDQAYELLQRQSAPAAGTQQQQQQQQHVQQQQLQQQQEPNMQHHVMPVHQQQ